MCRDNDTEYDHTGGWYLERLSEEDSRMCLVYEDRGRFGGCNIIIEENPLTKAQAVELSQMLLAYAYGPE